LLIFSNLDWHDGSSLGLGLLIFSNLGWHEDLECSFILTSADMMGRALALDCSFIPTSAGMMGRASALDCSFFPTIGWHDGSSLGLGWLTFSNLGWHDGSSFGLGLLIFSNLGWHDGLRLGLGGLTFPNLGWHGALDLGRALAFDHSFFSTSAGMRPWIAHFFNRLLSSCWTMTRRPSCLLFWSRCLLCQNDRRYYRIRLAVRAVRAILFLQLPSLCDGATVGRSVCTVCFVTRAQRKIPSSATSLIQTRRSYPPQRSFLRSRQFSSHLTYETPKILLSTTAGEERSRGFSSSLLSRLLSHYFLSVYIPCGWCCCSSRPQIHARWLFSLSLLLHTYTLSPLLIYIILHPRRRRSAATRVNPGLIYGSIREIKILTVLLQYAPPRNIIRSTSASYI